ncbi:hypothetical protein [Acinetobacter sp. 826659]|uniref:hypothetical protein n=1 Tax=Acinetobacter sp. 826659 TaxID=1310764 RepID=UPI00044C2EF6|nr:hypothetical protein [Acinetobacter sp. 826659]EXS35288.1 hypothetical protein J663_1199 [Acinetobacter sp. 826659]
MSTAIKSNEVYAGNKVLPNVVDLITETSERTEFLRKLLANIGGDTSYITDQNSDEIFDKLVNHRKRVVEDGGQVLSMANVARALVFAKKSNLSSDLCSAYSPDFGIKTNGSSVVKIYDLNGRDCELIAGSLERAVDGKLNVVKNLITTTMISKVNSIAGGPGMILGVCVHDEDAGSSTSQTVRGMYMSDNANASGAGLGYLETNKGGLSRLYYKRQVDGIITNLPYDQISNYKKFSGLVGYMSNIETTKGVPRVEIYENGVLKAGADAPQKDLSLIPIYPVISMLSLNSLFSESWLIKSTSQALALSLSNYLNKSI